MTNEILRKASEILEGQDKYVTGTWAVDCNDEPCAPAGKRALRWNLEGACFKAAFDLNLEPDDAMRCIELVLNIQRGEEGIWDKYVSESFGRVKQALDIAIVKSEAS